MQRIVVTAILLCVTSAVCAMESAPAALLIMRPCPYPLVKIRDEVLQERHAIYNDMATELGIAPALCTRMHTIIDTIRTKLARELPTPRVPPLVPDVAIAAKTLRVYYKTLMQCGIHPSRINFESHEDISNAVMFDITNLKDIFFGMQKAEDAVYTFTVSITNADSSDAVVRYTALLAASMMQDSLIYKTVIHYAHQYQQLYEHGMVVRTRIPATRTCAARFYDYQSLVDTVLPSLYQKKFFTILQPFYTKCADKTQHDLYDKEWLQRGCAIIDQMNNMWQDAHDSAIALHDQL